MDPQVAVLVAVLAAATVFGLWRRRQDGRIRGIDRDGDDAQVARAALGPEGHSAADTAERLTAAQVGAALGERASLVQFSTAFCQPCRATRRVLTDVVGRREGVAHIEIDAESHLDLVRRLDVRRTPTVLVLDGAGVVVGRAVGQPRADEVLAAIDAVQS